MATKKPPDAESPKTISAEASDWLRQFSKHFEMHLLDACQDLTSKASVSDFQLAAARAMHATYLDAGLEFESILELFGQVAVERRQDAFAWNDVLNQRRFALIDKEIQETLTSAERIELTGLTKIMRDHVEAEANLPIKGARALHRKLLQLEPTGESD